MLVGVRKGFDWRVRGTALRIVRIRTATWVCTLVFRCVIVSEPDVPLLQMRERMGDRADLPQNQQQAQRDSKCDARLAHYGHDRLIASIGKRLRYYGA